jgi:hypothetical protein
MKRRFFLFILILVGQLAVIVALPRALFALLNNPDQALEIIKGYDLLGNPAINGKAGEYISARANRARLEKRRWGCVLCGILDAVDENHCEKSSKT